MGVGTHCCGCQEGRCMCVHEYMCARVSLVWAGSSVCTLVCAHVCVSCGLARVMEVGLGKPLC